MKIYLSMIILSAVLLAACSSFRASSPLKNAKWSASEAHEEDEVTLCVDVSDSVPDTSVTFKVWEKEEDVSSDKAYAVLEGEVSGSRACVKWSYSSEDDARKKKRTQIPEFFFTVTIDSGETVRSGFIRICSWITIDLKDESGRPMKNVRFRFVSPDGKSYPGVTDENGTGTVDGLIPGVKMRLVVE